MSKLQELVDLPLEERQAQGIEFTPREILSQPKVWGRNFWLLDERERETWDFMIQSGLLGQNHAPRIFLSGAGTSDFIGRAVQLPLERHLQRPFEVYPTTSLVPSARFRYLPSGTVLIQFSRSGRSKETLAAVDEIEDLTGKKAFHIGITCTKDGLYSQRLREIGSERALVIELEDCCDQGLSMTCSFTTMIIAAQFLACIKASQDSDYRFVAEQLAKAGERILESSDVLWEIAGRVNEQEIDRIAIVGSNSLESIAEEGTLKVGELVDGRLARIADSTYGIQHGPNAAINRKTLACCLISSSEGDCRAGDLARLENMRELAGLTLAICGDPKDVEADYVINHAFPGHDLFRPPVDVIPFQILGLFLAVQLGLKPDNPSEERGAISRVAETVLFDPTRYRKDGSIVPYTVE